MFRAPFGSMGVVRTWQGLVSVFLEERGILGKALRGLGIKGLLARRGFRLFQGCAKPILIEPM